MAAMLMLNFSFPHLSDLVMNSIFDHHSDKLLLFERASFEICAINVVGLLV